MTMGTAPIKVIFHYCYCLLLTNTLLPDFVGFSGVFFGTEVDSRSAERSRRCIVPILRRQSSAERVVIDLYLLFYSRNQNLSRFVALRGMYTVMSRSSLDKF